MSQNVSFVLDVVSNKPVHSVSHNYSCNSLTIKSQKLFFLVPTNIKPLRDIKKGINFVYRKEE